MGKLSHIKDVEERAARQAAEQSAQGAQSTLESPEREQADAPDVQNDKAASQSAPQAARPKRSAADAEEDFHGISTMESLGFGHTALRALAVIVFIVAVLYVVNYWFHFI